MYENRETDSQIQSSNIATLIALQDYFILNKKDVLYEVRVEIIKFIIHNNETNLLSARKH